jgi:hypothetical protein
MSTDFDRTTIFHAKLPTTIRPHMTLQQFVSFVTLDAPDVRDEGANADAVIRRCYMDIPTFDADKTQPYKDARDCAIDEIRTRRSRVRVLENSVRSAAPSIRSAPMASMSDHRGGKDAVGEDSRMD